MASVQPQKPSTAIEVCQPKNQHSSFGQKISEITNKAFKGHHARNGSSSQNQVQCYSQGQVESHGQNGAKTATHHYGQTQTQHDKKHGVSKTQTQITVCVVQAQITKTTEDPSPYGTTTTCFGTHPKKKETNLFRRIKNGISRHGSEGNSSSSESESDDEKKGPKTKVDDEKKCPKTKARALK